MVLVLVLPMRRVFGLDDVITRAHLDAIAKLMLTMGLMLAYSYVIELFIAWYSGNQFERFTYLFDRPTGPYAVLYWVMTVLNVLTPQLFWVKRFRTSVPFLFIASLGILAGMWIERFIIIVTSLNHDFLTSSWHYYAPSWVDWCILGGSVSLFAFLFLLFIRFVPSVAISEVKELYLGLAEGQVDLAPIGSVEAENA
jgi:Ni/Fe-hydrogenase subunit HybB-like protein